MGAELWVVLEVSSGWKSVNLTPDCFSFSQ